MNPTLDDDLRQLHDQLATDATEGRSRLFAALAHQTPNAGRTLHHTGRRFGGLAAAAALMLATYVMFFANGTHTLAWAAVRDQLSRIHSLAWQQQSIVSATGYADEADDEHFWNRGYLQAPHQYRYEQRPADGLPPRITIRRGGEDHDTVLHLYPDEQRTVRRLVPRDAPSDEGTNVPGLIWTKLQSLREDDVADLGPAEFGGVPAVGFETARLELLFDQPGIPVPVGTVRLWVHDQTGVPIRVELRVQRDGQYFTTLIKQIEWNPQLSPSLFEVPAGEGWEIEDAAPRTISGHLKSGVTLRVTTATGEPVLSEAHVDVVSLSGPTGAAPHRRTLVATLTPEGEARLAEYTAAHIGDIVTISFNEEVICEPRIRAPLREMIRIDFTDVGPTLDELAQMIDELD